jgi:hypothetical protein
VVYERYFPALVGYFSAHMQLGKAIAFFVTDGLHKQGRFAWCAILWVARCVPLDVKCGY